LQPVEDDVVRRVQRLADLLQDHTALDLDLAVLERRIQQDIGHHVQPQRHVVFQNTHIIGGHLAAGVGIDIATDVLDRLGDLQGRPRLGALERHVFEKVRDPVLFQPLVPPPGTHPYPDGCRFHGGHVFSDDAEAV